MLTLLVIFWAIVELKYVLFWLYLWQLKDYHTGRFIDHFRTYKGNKIFFNFIYLAKLVLLILFFFVKGDFFALLVSVLSLIYLGETVLFIRAIVKKSVRKPKKTFKTLFLGAVCLAIIFILLILASNSTDFLQPIIILGFDVFTFIFISIIVLLFQPVFVFIRNKNLEKAKVKIERIKTVSALKVVAITGSYGKSSTKEFLTAILSQKYKTLSTKDNQNSEIGIAKCILEELKPSHQIFIAEVGAYDKGKVKEVCGVIKPKIGIVTGVNEQHIALFGSLQNLLSGEGGWELSESLPKSGILVINGDNKYCLDLYKKSDNLAHSNKKIYSFSNKTIDSDIWAESISVDEEKVSFVTIDRSGEMAHFEVKVLGKQNIQNLLGAILVAKELGMSFGEISEACKKITPEQAGMTIKNGKHGIKIIDSSYSSNPDGVMAELNYLSIYKGKKVIVMPCLIELGKKSSIIHEKIGEEIGEICDLAIITTADKFKEIKKGAMEAGMLEKNILLCDKPSDIHSIITLFCTNGDAVLLEGRVPSGLINLLVNK